MTGILKPGRNGNGERGESYEVWAGRSHPGLGGAAYRETNHARSRAPIT